MRLATCCCFYIKCCLEALRHGGNLLLLQEEAQSLRIPTRLLTVLKETVQSPAPAAAETASSSLRSTIISSPPLGMAMMPAKPLPSALQHAATANGVASASASGTTVAVPRDSGAAVLGTPKHDSAAGPKLSQAAKASRQGARKAAVREGAPLNGTAKQEESAGIMAAAEVTGAVEEAACAEALGIAIAGKLQPSWVLMINLC